MDLGLKDRIAIVNGASQGIGYGIARTLAQEGARVVATARREPRLLAAAKRIEEETGAKVLPVVADVRESEDCDRIVAQAMKHFGGIDLLVNNDGAPPLGTFMSFDDRAWLNAVEQNLLSVVRMIRGSVPHMRRRGGGAIVNITALSALEPLPEFGLSVASWGGVIGLAKTLSLELGADRITINTLCPGLIETPRLHKVTEQSGKAMRDLAQEIPLGRVGTPDDIASLVALLVSPRGSYITGTTIQVDGGLLRGVR